MLFQAEEDAGRECEFGRLDSYDKSTGHEATCPRVPSLGEGVERIAVCIKPPWAT